MKVIRPSDHRPVQSRHHRFRLQQPVVRWQDKVQCRLLFGIVVLTVDQLLWLAA